MNGRVAQFFGGRSSQTNYAAAATIVVPDNASWINLTGTATVTSLQVPNTARNRIVVFYQSDTGATTFTNTSGTSTQHLMDLKGSNITLPQYGTLVLRCRNDGSWVKVAADIMPTTSGSTVASATTTVIPDTGNIFYLSGSATITTLTGTTTAYPRRVTLIGAASAAVVLTNTDAPSSGQMYLRGSNRLLNESTVIDLILQTDGSWIIAGGTMS